MLEYHPGATVADLQAAAVVLTRVDEDRLDGRDRAEFDAEVERLAIEDTLALLK